MVTEVPEDYVSEILSQVAGDGDGDDVAGEGGDEIGLDYETEKYIDSTVSGLVEVGALTEVGAKRARKAIRKGIFAGRGSSTPQTSQSQQRATTQQPTRQQIALSNQQQRGARSNVSNQGINQQFAQSSRETERRAPLGFTEDGTGRNFFSLPPNIGATTTMRAKVSRVSHVDRLLIVPSAPGVVIESIKVGDEEQVLAPGVPAELYGASALTDALSDNFSPIGPGLDLSVTLRNTTASAITGTIGTKCACKR